MVTTDGEGVGNEVGDGDERGRAVSKIMGGALLGLGLPLVGRGNNRPLTDKDEISDEA